MLEKRLTLKAWIDHVGIFEVSKLLKVDRSAVSLWRRGVVLPRYYHMVDIVKYSRGKVTYATMIEDQVRIRARRKRVAS